jgi:hypothetical protein
MNTKDKVIFAIVGLILIILSVGFVELLLTAKYL